MSASHTTPLVLIPGFMLNESLWDDVMEQFPNDSNIYRANLLDGENISQIANRIAHNAPPRFILVGFSLGGYIARSLVEQFPDRVAALILIASSLRPDTPEQKQLKQAAITASAKGIFKGLSTTSIAKSLHPQRSADKMLINKIRNMGVELGYKEFAKQSLLERNALSPKTIQCPTLIIAAAQDALRLPEESAELHNAIPGSRLVIIQETGHMIPLEQPEVLASVITGWIDGMN